MRLRTFISDTMEEAVVQVREAMGDTAIIVSSLEGENGGFEVTAALDTRASSYEDAATDDAISLEEILNTKLNANKQNDSPAAPARDHPGERIDDTQSHPTEHSGHFLEESALLSALEEQGVPRLLMEAITADALKFDTDDAIIALSRTLETRFRFDPLPVAPRHPVMIVGLPGSGKTVTIAKLAARAVIDGALAQIICTDAERTGASAQSDAYGELLNVSVSHAETVDAMGLLLDQRADRTAIEAADTREACFIDTAATNPFLHANAKLLKRQIDAARLLSAAEPVLVLAAGGDARGMAEATQAFAKTGIKRMIVTQLDIARRLGGVIAAAEISGLAFAQISATPYLARGLVSVTPQRLAHLILGEPISRKK